MIYVFEALLASGAIAFMIAVFLVTGPVDDVPEAVIPEGWSIQSRGPWSCRRWDIRTPDGEWLGCSYVRRSTAVDHAWRCSGYFEKN